MTRRTRTAGDKTPHSSWRTTTPDKAADLVLLSQGGLAAPPSRIGATEDCATWLAGKRVFSTYGTEIP